MMAPWYGLLANLAVVALFVSSWAHFQAWFERFPPHVRSLAFGIHFGVASVVAMLVPVELRPGVFFDLRSALLALSGLFGGPFAALISASSALTYRFWVGGVGTFAGCASILTGAAAGVGLKLLIGQRAVTSQHLLQLGAAAGAATLLSWFLLPQPMWAEVFGAAAFPTAVLVLASTALGGAALLQTLQRIQATRANLVYHTMIDALPDCVNVKDLDGRFLAANQATARLMKAPDAAALIGKTDFDFYPRHLAMQFRTDEAEVLRTGRTVSVEQQVVREDNSITWLSTLKVPLRDEQGKLIGIITQNRDISETKKLEAELGESRVMLTDALAHMADALAMFDGEGRLLFCNEQYRLFFPLTADLRVPGVELSTILRASAERGESVGTPTEELEEWIRQTCDALRQSGDQEIQLFDGRWLHVRTRPASNGISMVVISDISHLKAAEMELRGMTDQLRVLATTDGLTGLNNRRVFDQALELEFARSLREGTPVCLLLIDLDKFKAYNDLYGHQAGDECLRRVAQCLRDTVRGQADLVARYGGEEFVVLLPNTDEDHAYRMAERFRNSVLNLAIPHTDSDKGIVTVSLGLAASGGHNPPKTPAELLRRSDQALYAAKAAGRNRLTGWRARYNVA